MSQFTSNNTSSNTTGGFSDTRPEHHIHGSADPLPGTRGVNPVAYDSMESSTAGAGVPSNTNFGAAASERHHESSNLPGGLGDKTRADRHTESGAGQYSSQRQQGSATGNPAGVLGSHDDNTQTDRQTGLSARQPEAGHRTGELGSHAATQTDRRTETGAGQTHSGAGYDDTVTGTGPLDHHQGGIAAGGRSDVPQGHPSAVDKIIGKSEKVYGKVSHNSEMQERGQLRETGGKAAVTENARAARD